jgi:hypothetical protein
VTKGVPSTGNTVAVVVATYDGARFIEGQLASILGQTRPPDQIVISDDSSTDGTLEVARTALIGFPGQLVITTNPGPRGVVPNFSHALRLADADLLALSDQDDLWHPEKIGRMAVAFAERPDLLMLHSDARLVDAEGIATGGTLLQSLSMTDRIRRQVHQGDGAEVLLRRNFVAGATSMLRRTLLTRALPIPDGWLHDEWLAMVAAALGGLDLVEESLVDYRQHGGNEVGARVLGLADKARRLMVPRRARDTRLLVRASQLPDRLSALGSDPALVSAARAKLEHERRRSALPIARLQRIPTVSRAMLRGDYHRFGRGAADAVRDIVQPA